MCVTHDYLAVSGDAQGKAVHAVAQMAQAGDIAGGVPGNGGVVARQTVIRRTGNHTTIGRDPKGFCI